MRYHFALLLSVIFTISRSAHAEIGAPADDANEALAGLYAGQYSIFRDFHEATPMVGGEYRYKDIYYGIRPTVGGFITGSSTAYGSVGINWDLPLGIAPFFLTPAFGIGAYNAGAGKPLGLDLEFRSTLEATYQFATHERIGVEISHLSNAGLGDKNPGVETFQAVYVLPLGSPAK